MPFEDETTPSNGPAVQMFFHGLVVLHSDAGQEWRADLHREAGNHVLSIEVRLKDPPGPDVILMRHHGHLPPNDPDLTITMLDGSGAALSPIAKRFVSINNNVEDFRAVLDLRTLHTDPVVVGQPGRPPVVVKRQKTRAGILVNGGESVLYAARIEERSFELRNAKGDVRILDKLASIVGARLYYGGNGASARISGGGLPKPIVLEKPAAESGISYEIYVNNNPLVELDEETTQDSHSELKHYYQIVERQNGDDILPNEQFELIPESAFLPAPRLGLSKATLGDDFRASIRIPCMPTTVDR